MKAFAVVLLCLFAAVQGRSFGLQELTAAARGENPWVVHLRVAVSTSGLLNTCTGSIISDSWVLTSASCIRDARFVWIRYAAVDVTRPELVMETSTVRVHPDFNAETGEFDGALLSLNSPVESTANIQPVELAAADAVVPENGQFCGYGTNDDGTGPGETLNCYDVTITQSEDGNLVTSSDVKAGSSFDRGGALVSEGVQYGVLTGPGADNTGVFLNVANILDWINSETQPAIVDLDDGYVSEVNIVN